MKQPYFASRIQPQPKKLPAVKIAITFDEGKLQVENLGLPVSQTQMMEILTIVVLSNLQAINKQNNLIIDPNNPRSNPTQPESIQENTEGSNSNGQTSQNNHS